MAKSSPPDTLQTVIDASNIAQRALEKRLWGIQLSVPQQRILAAVHGAKEPLTPSMLAVILLQETHSVSGLLNRLEDRDLITRTRDRKDRRVVWVGLTDAGRKVAEKSIKIVADTEKEIGSGLGAPATASIAAAAKEIQSASFKIVGVREDFRAEALKRAGQA